jgi:ribosomal protein S18 acetylase RimI-like enzyme
MVAAGEVEMSDVLRAATVDDHPRIVQAVQDWWGDSRDPAEARELSLLLPRLFLQHFASTSLVLERGDELVGFLVGFYSSDRPQEAYIHFVGVSPLRRRERIAARLYEQFFSAARAAGKELVRAVTSPQNTSSIAFHLAQGFDIEQNSDADEDSTVFPDYDGPGQPRVCFVRAL